MKNLPVIKGERVLLRQVQDSDAELYFCWLKDPELRGLVGEPELEVEEISKEQKKWREDENTLEYIIVSAETGCPIGDISIKGVRDNQPKYSIMIPDNDLRGKGYGTEAMALLFDYARSLGLEQIFAEVFPTNPGSVRFHEKTGFRSLGMTKDGEGKDCYLYVKDLNTREN